eukprot:scaffold26294_cov112-Isochrysis_galbana.AAC.4
MEGGRGGNGGRGRGEWREGREGKMGCTSVGTRLRRGDGGSVQGRQSRRCFPARAGTSEGWPAAGYLYVLTTRTELETTSDTAEQTKPMPADRSWLAAPDAFGTRDSR